MHKLVRNTAMAIRHPALGIDYLRWRIANVIGRPRMVEGAFDTRLHTSTFADLRSTRAFVPKSPELNMIRTLRSNPPMFVDIGANLGVWTVALAAAHPDAQVYCFEPTPDTFAMLRKNIGLNRLQNVTALQLAVSDSAGMFRFQMNEHESIFNRLAPSGPSGELLARGRFADARFTEVRSVVLDDFCRERDIERIGFLKIDVEGAEVSVLKGAQRLLRNRAIDLIWIEVEPDNLLEMGESLENLAQMMGSVGYTFHFLQSDGSAGPPVDINLRRSLNMMAKPAQTA